MQCTQTVMISRDFAFLNFFIKDDILKLRKTVGCELIDHWQFEHIVINLKAGKSTDM
jgi:hypothetical protein